jgi:hypothetical protein
MRDGNQLNKLNIKNVRLLYIPNQRDIESFLEKFQVDCLTVFSVDTVCGYNRPAFLNRFLEHGICKKLRMVVLDNYADPMLVPLHFNKEIFPRSLDWDVYKYDALRWCGSGTKLYMRRSNNR